MRPSRKPKPDNLTVTVETVRQWVKQAEIYGRTSIFYKILIGQQLIENRGPEYRTAIGLTERQGDRCRAFAKAWARVIPAGTVLSVETIPGEWNGLDFAEIEALAVKNPRPKSPENSPPGGELPKPEPVPDAPEVPGDPRRLWDRLTNLIHTDSPMIRAILVIRDQAPDDTERAALLDEAIRLFRVNLLGAA